jgi:ornithine carbamoyltransferase
VIYTDSWMSYHIDPAELEERVAKFMPYQVTNALMKSADPKAIFMNCLPAARGYEQTAEVIDGPQSVVFDQAENRMHAQNAVMLRLLSQV